MQDLIVLGGGTSGLIVAVGALRQGLKVTLVEKNARLGGSSLHNGCVPSKALLHATKLYQMFKNSYHYGIDSSVMLPDLRKINQYVNKVSNSLEAHETIEIQKIFQEFGGVIVYGTPKFIDAQTIIINSVVLKAKKFVIATGSRPFVPAIKGLNDIGYITSDKLFSQEKFWDSLTILGGSHTAIEFAQAFARLGCKVTIVTHGDSILPQEEPELVEQLNRILLQSGIIIHLNTTVQNVYLQGKLKVLDCLHDSGKLFTVASDQILLAIGNKPNLDGLGLENAGIAYVENGIIVNQHLQTTQENIYALGDVAKSAYKLTHIAEQQANVVLNNILFKYPAKIEYLGMPYVIFTEPEYAHVGLTVQQAKDQKYKNIKIAKFAFKDLDISMIHDTPLGMIKVVTSKDKVIGATILGAHASILIAEWSLAINMGAKLATVAATMRAYPTFAQINRRVACARPRRVHSVLSS